MARLISANFVHEIRSLSYDPETNPTLRIIRTQFQGRAAPVLTFQFQSKLNLVQQINFIAKLL